VNRLPLPLPAISPIFFLVSSSLTTMKRHGCASSPVGAHRAASKHFNINSSGTGSGLYFLMLLLSLITFNTVSASFVSVISSPCFEALIQNG
jgi:hypothetical protein